MTPASQETIPPSKEEDEEEPTTTYRSRSEKNMGLDAADALESPPRQDQLLLARGPELLARCSPPAVRLAPLAASSEKKIGIGCVCILSGMWGAANSLLLGRSERPIWAMA